MALWEKTPAIYTIRNKRDGRIYVGSSKDVTKRFKQWMHSVKKAEEGSHAYDTNPLIMDIVKYGWDNFEFKIIDSTPEMFDAETRSIREVEYIMKYRSIMPKYGYNSTMGGESGSSKHRYYPKETRNTKPKSLFLYDIETDNIYLFLKGTASVHDFIGCKRGLIPDATQRGKLLKGRYFSFYTNTERREMFAKYIDEDRDQLETNGNNSSKSVQRYKLYKHALKEVNKYAKKCGFN